MTSQSQDSYDLGEVHQLDAESVGPPGGRHFRLRARCDGGSALLWLEKEQMYELAVAIKQLLKKSIQEGDEPPPSAEPDPEVDYDFKIARMALGQDQNSERYMLLSHVADEDASVSLWMDEDQLDGLADQAFDVCASGRPRCPLCGAPTEDGEPHVCPKTNGYHKVE